MKNPIISVKEARKILGKDADGMSDEQIEETIQTLDTLAGHALELAKQELSRKRDAKALAELTYDIYKDTQNKG